VTGQCFLVFALFSALCAFAQEAPKISDAEREIRALETVRLKSPNKTDAWSEAVAKDALFQLANGVVLNKHDLLARMQSEAFKDSSEISDSKFSEFGDVAIFSYVFMRTHLEDPSMVFHQHLRRMLVYKRTASGWQMIASAISIIPYNDLESRSVDPKILDTYLGVWTDVPAPSTVTLAREGGKLIAQGSNDPEKTELLPLSDNTFVVRGDSTLITFEKGPDSKVTRMLSRDLGGSVQLHERASAARQHQ
jgi:hypothetical protein